MSRLSRTEKQLEVIAHLLLPTALPEPLPIWWQLDDNARWLEIELVFALRHLLHPVLRRAIGIMELLEIIPLWSEDQLFQSTNAFHVWLDAQSVDSLMYFLPILSIAYPATSSLIMDRFYARYGHRLMEILDDLSYGYGGIKHAWLASNLLRSLARSDSQRALKLLQDRGDSIFRNYGYETWREMFYAAMRDQRKQPHWTITCVEALHSPLQRIVMSFSERDLSALFSSRQLFSWIDEVHDEDLFVAAWSFLSHLPHEWMITPETIMVSSIADKLGLPFDTKLNARNIDLGYYPSLVSHNTYIASFGSCLAWIWLHASQDTPEWYARAVTRLTQIYHAARNYILGMIYGIPKAPHARHSLAHMLVHHPGLAAWITFAKEEKKMQEHFSALERFAQTLDDAALKYAMHAQADQLRRMHDIYIAARHAAYQYILRCFKNDYDRAEDAQARVCVVERATSSSAFMDGFLGTVNEACLLQGNMAFGVDM